MRYQIMRRDAPVQAPPTTLEADWQARINAAGVRWYHDFRSDAEVNNFRWSAGVGGGNDPGAVGTLASNLRRITTDGLASGACLEIIRGPGAGEPSIWWRPFSPMTAPGNGKAADDPGGGITPRVWNATQGGSQLTNWNQGWYGHPTYAAADPTHFEGTDFYLQVVCKMDPRRITGGNAANTVGKFIWFSTAEGAQSLSNAEHVTWSYGNGGNDGAKNYVRVYSLGTTGPGGPNSGGAFGPLDDDNIAPGSRIQPGSSSATDWSYSGGWDVLVYHLRLGLLNTISGPDSTLLEIWAAHEGETSYTKIWSLEYGNTAYEARNGLQALILAAYNNGASFPQQFYHRYAQVIFSTQMPACPQVWPSSLPAWYANQTASTWQALNTRISDLGSAVDSGMFAYSGMVASRNTLISAAQGGHSDTANNAVVTLNLLAAAPTWTLEVAKSSSAQIDTPYYADGKPTSRHGYSSQCFIPNGVTNGNRWFAPVATHAWGNAFSYGDAASYRLGSGAYDPQGFFPSYTPTFKEHNGTSFDSATNTVVVKDDWTFGSGGGYRIMNPATKTYTGQIGPTQSKNDGYLNTAIDPNRRIFLIIDNSAPFLLAYDLADQAHAPYTISTTGTALPVAQGVGLEFDPINQCFYAWNGGQTIYKLQPNATNWRTLAWTVTTLTIAGGSATPTAPYVNGTFGKFRYIADLHALIVVNDWNQTPFVFKLP